MFHHVRAVVLNCREFSIVTELDWHGQDVMLTHKPWVLSLYGVSVPASVGSRLPSILLKHFGGETVPMVSEPEGFTSGRA